LVVGGVEGEKACGRKDEWKIEKKKEVQDYKGV